MVTQIRDVASAGCRQSWRQKRRVDGERVAVWKGEAGVDGHTHDRSPRITHVEGEPNHVAVFPFPSEGRFIITVCFFLAHAAHAPRKRITAHSRAFGVASRFESICANAKQTIAIMRFWINIFQHARNGRS